MPTSPIPESLVFCTRPRKRHLGTAARRMARCKNLSLRSRVIDPWQSQERTQRQTVMLCYSVDCSKRQTQSWSWFRTRDGLRLFDHSKHCCRSRTLVLLQIGRQSSICREIHHEESFVHWAMGAKRHHNSLVNGVQRSFHFDWGNRSAMKVMY